MMVVWNPAADDDYFPQSGLFKSVKAVAKVKKELRFVQNISVFFFWDLMIKIKSELLYGCMENSYFNYNLLRP